MIIKIKYNLNKKVFELIISDLKKFIFFHIPKCGGSTVRVSLWRYNSSKNYVWYGQHPVYNRKIDKMHIPYEDFLFMPEAFKLDNYLKFCFVRNPYNRIYSAFLQHVNQHTLINPEYGRIYDKELMKKLKNPELDFNTYIQTLIPHQVRFDYRFIHFCPMHYFTHYKKQCQMNFIGRLENFSNDFAKVCKLLSIDNIDFKTVNINTENKKIGLSYLEKYESSTIKFINKLYAEDFDLFGYEKINL